MTTPYDDDCPTYVRTYAGLRIYHDAIDSERITDMLGVEPTCTFIKGQIFVSERGVTSVPTIGGWFLSSKDMVDSGDVCRHVDWILVKLASTDEAIKSLQDRGHRIEIFCYWLSAHGHDGPTVSPSIMRRLGELDIEIGFDVYGPYTAEDEDDDDEDDEDDRYGLFDQDEDDE